MLLYRYSYHISLVNYIMLPPMLPHVSRYLEGPGRYFASRRTEGRPRFAHPPWAKDDARILHGACDGGYTIKTCWC